MTRLRNGLLLALWSIAVPVSLLAGAEVVLRIADFGGGRSAQTRPPWMDDATFDLWRESVDRLGVELDDVTDLAGWQQDDVLRWALKPGVSMTARNIFVDPGLDAGHWSFETNDRGFRTPAFELERRPGVLRVVTLGDSNTMGWLLDEEATYPRRLESYLARLLGRPVEVINLGVGGYSSFSALQLFRREAMRLSPDAVVLSIGANDGQWMDTSDARFAAADRARWLSRLRNLLGGLKLARAVSGLLPARAWTREQRVSPSEYHGNLSALFQDAQKSRIPVVFHQVCCCPESYETGLREATREHGISVVRAQDVLERAAADPAIWREHAAEIREITSWYAAGQVERDATLLFYFRDRCHLNALGAELVAESLAKELAARLRDR